MENDKNQSMSIDEFALEKEWKRQPDLFEKYGTELVEAQDLYDAKKNSFDFKRAALEMDVRANPTEFGIDKVTEATINAAIAVDPVMNKLAKELLALKKRTALLRVAVDACEQRRRALAGLTDLWVHDYYSERNKEIPSTSARVETLTEEERRAVRSRRLERKTDEPSV